MDEPHAPAAIPDSHAHDHHSALVADDYQLSVWMPPSYGASDAAYQVGYALDGAKGIRDPRGMVARQFGVDMNVVTADATVAKNLMLVVERCHLNVEAMSASPYVAGLSVLTDDEADLGAAVVEMGAGSTTIAT